MNREDWNILDTGVHTAEENMQIDADLLETLDPFALPILHFYDWERPSATYGYFVNPSEFLNVDEIENQGIDLSKRPTGGGIVFHIWDLAFSVLIPAKHPRFSEATLDNYAFVNQAVRLAISEFLATKESIELIQDDAEAIDSSCTRFCMAQPTKYDVVFQGRKIAGAAQRKTKRGFLHQGTIALKMPDEDLLGKVILPHTKVLEGMLANTFALLRPDEDLHEGRMTLRSYLEKHLTLENKHATKS